MGKTVKRSEGQGRDRREKGGIEGGKQGGMKRTAECKSALLVASFHLARHREGPDEMGRAPVLNIAPRHVAFTLLNQDHNLYVEETKMMDLLLAGSSSKQGHRQPAAWQ